MPSDILILGQGLAGTLVGWALEKAGLSFAIADPGHARAATLAAAGIVNPITGRRLVKSWRVEELRPLAATTYRELEQAFGAQLWSDMRVRRFFADQREQCAFAAKSARGELAPFAGAGDDEGFWIEGAARVDLPRLLQLARARWRAAGKLREEAVTLAAARERHACVIDCRGLATTLEREFAFVPWEFSKGEVLELACEGLAPEVILNRRHWAVPVGNGAAWVGATHEPGRTDATVSAEARRTLEASAAALLPPPFAVQGQRAGVRVNLPDKRPVAGKHPGDARIGMVNALGAKGALLAPWLARQWAEHLSTGAAFDPQVDVQRFWPRG